MVVSLRSILQQPMGLHALRAKVPDYCRVVLYSSLLNDERHRGTIFGNKKCLIVLYEGNIDGKMQAHYVCLSKRHNRIEYFSSMGFNAKHELTILGLKGKKPAFERLLGKAYEVNRKRLQMDKYNVNDCAWWSRESITVQVEFERVPEILPEQTQHSEFRRPTRC